MTLARVITGRFRPSLAATLITLPAVLVMLALGTWQLQRLAWKEGLIARLHARMAEAPVPLPAAVDDPDAFDLRPVIVAGVLHHDRARRVPARPQQGRAGYEIITPLSRDAGPPVLVNLGWVPLADRDPPQGDEPAVLRGVARVPAASGWVTIPPGMAPLVVEALPGQRPGNLPAGIVPRAELPNNHVQYALTWYGLAVTLLVIYLLSQRRPPDHPAGRPSGHRLSEPS